MEVEIGRGKKGRRAYGFDDIAIVPSRRTRDAEDVDITWKLGPFTLPLPCLASAMDGVVDPGFAVAMGKLGGLAVLNLEGVQTRYENADEQLDRIASLPKETATRTMQEIYQEPIKAELVARRIKEIKDGGVLAAASLTPQRVEQYYKIALDAGLDVLVIQGTVVSAEHVSTRVKPLNLKEFIADCPVPVIVGGVASYATTLHLMRTGADRRAGRRRPGPRLHHARRARHRRAAGDGHRRRRRGPHPAPARDRPVLQRHRRRRHAHRRRRHQGRSPWAPTPS